MPKFPENTGFKLPGIGSKEKDTPGNFREDQRVEDVGYCDNTEAHMLPQGSSPLLATDDPKDWLVPDYYSTTYTGSAWPKGKDEPSGDKDDDNEEEVENKNIATHVETNQTPGIEGQEAVEEKIEYTPPTITKEGTAAYNALTLEQQQAQDKKWKKLNTKIIPGKAAVEAVKGTSTTKYYSGSGEDKKEISLEAFCALRPNHPNCKK